MFAAPSTAAVSAATLRCDTTDRMLASARPSTAATTSETTLMKMSAKISDAPESSLRQSRRHRALMTASAGR